MIKVGYEVEMATPLSEKKVRKFFEKNGLPVKPGIQQNHNGEYSDWSMSKDGSIHPNALEDTSWELISPIMELDESLRVLKIVFDWMIETGGYTNQTTGFHCGISHPDAKAMEKLDKLKLVLLFHEKEVLKTFGRENSNWARNIEPDLLNTLSQQVNAAKNKYNPVLNSNFKTLIGKSVPSSKAYSANLSHLPTYIEFRAMGGEYHTKYKKCKDTILHYAEIVEAACDSNLLKDQYEEKYQQFLKKLKSLVPNLEEIIKKNNDFLEKMLQRDKARRLMRTNSNLEIIIKPKSIYTVSNP